MNVDFACTKHDWDKKFALLSMVNIFFNNEQKNVNDFFKEEQMKDFKKGKRNNLYILFN